MTDLENDVKSGEFIKKPKKPKKNKKRKKNSKKTSAPGTLFAKLKRAGNSVRDYIRENPSEILLTTIAILMLDVEGSLDSIEDWSEDFQV